MGEKKIFSIDVAMDEPMYRAIHGLAEADGVSASELMRMLASTLIEERATYYARLHSIFGYEAPELNEQRSGKRPETKPSDPPTKAG